MNESELIQAARGGDEAAFEQLVRLHEKKIYNLCLRMCGSSEDAAEAAQDTFLPRPLARTGGLPRVWRRRP